MSAKISGICSMCHKVPATGAYCPPCRKIWRANSPTAIAKEKERYVKNRDHILAGNKKWRAANPDYMLRYNREYREKNLEVLRLKDRQYAEGKRAEKAAYARRYRLANPDKCRETISKWRRTNPDAVSVYVHRRLARKAAVLGSHTAEEWKAVLTNFGNRCAHCGVKGRLTKDHIVPLSDGGSNFIFNLQPLCKPCNSRKSAKLLPGVNYSLFDRPANSEAWL